MHREPNYGYMGVVILPCGRYMTFNNWQIGLNGQGAASLARDKDFCLHFIGRFGWPVPEGRAFYSDRWCRVIGSENGIEAAVKYADKVGWPLVAKMNSGSCGRMIFQVNSTGQLRQASEMIFAKDKIMRLEELVCGREFRAIVLDEKVLLSYERIMPESGNIQDSDGLTSPARNLPAGGQLAGSTDRVHSDWERSLTNLVFRLGLRYAALDIISATDLSEKPDNYRILEVNAAPILSTYASLGVTENEQVHKILDSVFEAAINKA